MQQYVFESPERFVVGTVGQPGERAFYLQATARGRMVTVGLDKAEVAALADGLTLLLDEVRKGQPHAVPDATTYLDRAPLDGPFEEDFRLGQLTVSWDGRRVLVEAAGTAVGAPEPAVGPSEEPDLLQVALSVEQTYAFVARAHSVVAAGRPPCLLCGRPDGPDGHFCPRLN